MAESIIWAHGTSLSTETLDNITDNSRMGWGADISVRPGKNAWLHASIPVTVPRSSRIAVREVYVLFFAQMGAVRDIHVYDGSTLVYKFDGLHLEGEHRGKLNNQNTFTLPLQQRIVSGLGISLRFNGAHNMLSGVDPRLIVSAVGARLATPPFSWTSFTATIRSLPLVNRTLGS